MIFIYMSIRIVSNNIIIIICDYSSWMEAYCTCVGLVPDCSLHVEYTVYIKDIKINFNYWGKTFANSKVRVTYPPGTRGWKQKSFIEYIILSILISVFSSILMYAPPLLAFCMQFIAAPMMVSHRIKQVPIKYNFDIKLHVGWRLKKEALNTNLIYKLNKALYIICYQNCNA